MEKRHHRRITPSPLEIADILLRETGYLGETLLRESLLTPQPCKVQSNEAAHIHTRHAGRYILSGLSFIRCICPIQRPSCHAASSEERRVGKECVSTCRFRGSQYH